MPPRNRPLGQFNFTVDFGPDPGSVEAGFQEVTGLGWEITVTDYRNGNEKDNGPRKVTALSKVNDVVMKRGVIGDATLYEWMRQVADGAPDQLRTVVVHLLAENREPAQSWRLTNARPVKYVGPSLKGDGNAVAVDEVHLACEKVTQEFD